jgi:hypothetical protein
MLTSNHKRGISLLITLVITSVLMGISASLLNITLKQFLLSGIANESERAFQAASAGIECTVYHDVQNPANSAFDVNSNGTARPSVPISCMGNSSVDWVDDPDGPGGANPSNSVVSGKEQRFRFDWGNPGVCTEVSVYKYTLNQGASGGTRDMSYALGQPAGTTQCPEGTATSPVECTVIQSRGYNVPCTNIGTSRTIERELIQRY